MNLNIISIIAHIVGMVALLSMIVWVLNYAKKKRTRIVDQISKSISTIYQTQGDRKFPFVAYEIIQEFETGLINLTQISSSNESLVAEMRGLFRYWMNTAIYEHVAAEGYHIASLVESLNLYKLKGLRGFFPIPTWDTEAISFSSDEREKIIETSFMRMVADKVYKNMKQTKRLVDQLVVLKNYQAYVVSYYASTLGHGAVSCPGYGFFGFREKEVWQHMVSLADKVVADEVHRIQKKISPGMKLNHAVTLLNNLEEMRESVGVLATEEKRGLINGTHQQVLEALGIEGKDLRCLARSGIIADSLNRRKKNENSPNRV